MMSGAIPSRQSVTDVVLEAVAPTNVDDLAALLRRRNDTLPAYTQWKYADSDRGFRGVVARIDNRAVGCFGIVPRELCMSDGSTLSSGWFADWYVAPEARGRGIGADMLRALSLRVPVIFGHPGTARAQALCFANGYRTIEFQSRRRVVLHAWRYQRRRANLATVAAVRVVGGLLGGMIERHVTLRSAIPPADRPAFRTDASYAEWILAQPVAHGQSRTGGVWRAASGAITYVDDVLHSGERRRLVLHAAPATMSDGHAWKHFALDARRHDCAYVDCFTTDRRLDVTLAALGARTVRDAPVVVTGLPSGTEPVSLHGWDRENWTYLASDPDVQ